MNFIDYIFPFKKANRPNKYEVDPSSNPYEFNSI